jgi:hypothetical protein
VFCRQRDSPAIYLNPVAGVKKRNPRQQYEGEKADEFQPQAKSFVGKATVCGSAIHLRKASMIRSSCRDCRMRSRAGANHGYTEAAEYMAQLARDEVFQQTVIGSCGMVLFN